MFALLVLFLIENCISLFPCHAFDTESAPSVC